MLFMSIIILELYANSTKYDEIAGNLDAFLTDVFCTFLIPKNISAIVSEIKQFYFKNKVSSDKYVVYIYKS